MHPIQIASTAGLVVAVLALGWHQIRSRSSVRPFGERTAVAVCFLPVAWSALTWLQADHSDASAVRVVAVWAQLISSGLLIVLLLVAGWVRREPMCS